MTVGRLHVITDTRTARRPVDVVRAALAGAATWRLGHGIGPLKYLTRTSHPEETR